MLEISRNLLTGEDLFGVTAGQFYTHAVGKGRTFRQRIDDQFILLRDRKGWSRRRAAHFLEADQGTIKAIERGGNVGWDFFERYAKKLGTSFEDICECALSRLSTSEMTPEESLILRAYRTGTLEQRGIILDTAQEFVRAGALSAGTPPPSATTTPDDREATRETPEPKRKSRRTG